VVVWHPVTPSDLATAWRTLAGFVLPIDSWRQAVIQAQWVMPAIMLATSLGIGAWILFRLRQLRSSDDPKRQEVLSLLNGLFFFAYIASILATMFLFDASTKFKPRILAPAFVSMLVLLVALGAWAWTRRRTLVIAAGAAVLALSAFGQVGAFRELTKGGQGYASFRWYDSEAMAFLRLLPDDVAIYTNEPGAVYLYTGRPAYVLPDRADPVTGEERPGFESGLAQLQGEVNSGRAVLALLRGGDLPAADGAALSAGLYLVHKSGGSEIYSAEP
jgi:hypothetical protein